MAETIRFEAYKPDGQLLTEANAIEVIVPGEFGSFGVRKSHQPFLATLGVGVLEVRTEVGTTRILVADGFCEVSADKVVILAETAERAEDIDLARAKRAHERAKERLAKMSPGDDMQRAQAALKRAEVRLEVVSPS